MQDDILAYGWLCQMVREQWPNLDSAAAGTILSQAIMEMVRTRQAIIGTAMQKDGVVIVAPWDGEPADIAARLQDVVATYGINPKADQGFSFWLQKCPVD